MSTEERPLLVLDPRVELHFKGPFTEVVTSHLKLNNPTDRRICFKVKTTAPKRYCVRPNNGIVEPKSTALIAVMLQPFDIESQTDRNKHKFMVQTMFVPEGDVNQDALWREASSDQIHDSKLKCVFDVTPRPSSGTGNAAPPAGSGVGTINNVSSSEQVLPSVPLSSSTHAVPQSPQNLLNSSNVSSSAFGRGRLLIDSDSGDTLNHDTVTTKSNPNTTTANIPGGTSTIGSTITPRTLASAANTASFTIPSKLERSPIPTPPSPAGGKSLDELRSLQSEVSRLRNENMHLKEEGLRQRIRAGESGSRNTSAGASTAELLKSANQLRNSSNHSSNGLAGQEVVQLLMNPNVLAIGLVLFVIGIVLGKVVF